MFQNPRPRTFAELTALLDSRNATHGILPHPEPIKEKEAQRLLLVARTYERLAGED